MECYESAIPAIFLYYAPTFFMREREREREREQYINIWIERKTDIRITTSLAL